MSISLANIFHLHVTPAPGPQITSERPIEKFLEHLKADPRQRSIIPTLAKFVTDEGIYSMLARILYTGFGTTLTLCPSWFVE